MALKVASPFKPKVVQPRPSAEMLALARREFELQPCVRPTTTAFSQCMGARMAAVEAVSPVDGDPTRRWRESLAHRCDRANTCEFCAIVSRTIAYTTGESLLAMYIKYNEQTCTRRVCVNTIYEKYELFVKLVAREVGEVGMHTNMLGHPLWTHPKRACFFYARFVLCWQLAVIDAQLRQRPYVLEAAWLHARARSGESVDEAFRVLATLCCGGSKWPGGVDGAVAAAAALATATTSVAVADAEARLRRDAWYQPGARGRCPSKYIALF
jgi:hypothetical protein